MDQAVTVQVTPSVAELPTIVATTDAAIEKQFQAVHKMKLGKIQNKFLSGQFLQLLI